MTLEMDKSDFVYTLALKIDDLVACKTKQEFDGVADLSINSRTFSNYFDCSNSVKELLNNVVKTINEGIEDKAHQYMLTSEVNPLYTGIETKSKDWETGELARLWMFDSQQDEDDVIMAVGQARVYAVDREPPKHLH